MKGKRRIWRSKVKERAGEMFENIEWIFFDVGSTIVDEHIAYEHRMQEIADLANTNYSSVYEMAMTFCK